jgi:hypothetical protein
MNKVVTEQPKHSESLLSALERTLQHHDLRLRPGQTLADVADVLEKHQIAIEEQKGYLQASQHGNPVHVATAFEALPERAPDMFFPRNVAGVKSKEEMDTKAKVDFIREFGDEAFRNLPVKAPVQQTVVLDPSRMKRDQWLSLDLSTRAQLAAQWGPDQVGKVMARRG